MAGGGGAITLLVRHRAHGSDLGGIIRLLAAGLRLLAVIVVYALVRHCGAWECRHQPEEHAQSKKLTNRHAHDCLRCSARTGGPLLFLGAIVRSVASRSAVRNPPSGRGTSPRTGRR